MIYTTKRLYTVFGIVFTLLLASGCGVNGRNPGVLRGNTVLSIRFPLANEKIEVLGLDKDRVASRAFLPLTNRSFTREMLIQEDMFNELEQLRHDWCETPPTFIPDELIEANYEVVFQCGKNTNPVYRIRPSELPAPFQELVDLVPSPRQD